MLARLRVLGYLHTVEVVGPQADAKLVEPQLLVRRRFDRRLDHAAPGIATPGLIDQVHTEMATQENVLESFAAIGSGFPGLGELTCAMPHDDGQFSCVDRDLVEGVGMVTVIGLAIRSHRLARVERARRRGHRSTGGEAALRLNH
ncbi:hypothetical protein D3C76_1344400 [compost metagenome]